MVRGHQRPGKFAILSILIELYRIYSYPTLALANTRTHTTDTTQTHTHHTHTPHTTQTHTPHTQTHHTTNTHTTHLHHTHTPHHKHTHTTPHTTHTHTHTHTRTYCNLTGEGTWIAINKTNHTSPVLLTDDLDLIWILDISLHQTKPFIRIIVYFRKISYFLQTKYLQ